jgi:DnaK suppressor protein
MKKMTTKTKTATRPKAKAKPKPAAIPSGKGSSLKKKEMEAYKARLLEMRKALTKGVRTNEDNGKENATDEVRDLADQASDSYDRELAFGLSEAERSRLSEVDEALERISKGRYGVCDNCGNPISASRLKALPFARLCVDCKSKEEQVPREA